MKSPIQEADPNNFETLFKYMTIAMRINRFHPHLNKDVKWACQFILMYSAAFVIFSLFIYNMIFFDLKNNDSVTACANGIIGIIFCVLTFQYCVVFYYQKDIRDMIENMNENFAKAKDLTEGEQAIVKEYVKKEKFVVTFWVMISLSASSLFFIKSLVIMAYYAIFDEFRLVPIYDLYYPGAIEESKNNLGVFILLNTFFFIYDTYVMFIFMGFEPLGPVFMLHACCLLEIVKKRVTTLFVDSNSDEEIYEQLKDVACSLQEIYSFIDKIKRSFKVLYELTLKTTVLISPVTFYQIIESLKLGELRIEFFCIFVGGITMSSIPCYYSDRLMEAGEQLRLAIYLCGWEKRWTKKSRTLILLLLVRTTPPVTIRTMFRPLCLDALTDVFHQGYAIFNLLNAAFN